MRRRRTADWERPESRIYPSAVALARAEFDGRARAYYQAHEEERARREAEAAEAQRREDERTRAMSAAGVDGL